MIVLYIFEGLVFLLFFLVLLLALLRQSARDTKITKQFKRDSNRYFEKYKKSSYKKKERMLILYIVLMLVIAAIIYIVIIYKKEMNLKNAGIFLSEYLLIAGSFITIISIILLPMRQQKIKNVIYEIYDIYSDETGDFIKSNNGKKIRVNIEKWSMENRQICCMVGKIKIDTVNYVYKNIINSNEKLKEAIQKLRIDNNLYSRKIVFDIDGEYLKVESNMYFTDEIRDNSKVATYIIIKNCDLLKIIADELVPLIEEEENNK